MVHGASTPKDELLLEFRNEYEKLKVRLGENQQLIEQSQLEVDRLREKNVALNIQFRRIEANFDTIPRSDIKAAYDDLIDAKSRLLTMQGQLEKLKGNQEELQYFERLLGRLLNLVQGVTPDRLPAPSVPGTTDMLSTDGSSLSTQAIVRIVEAQEVERQRLARQMLAWGQTHVTERLARAYVEEVGRAAIDLYGGRLKSRRDADLAPGEPTSQEAIDRTTVQPLRLLLAGPSQRSVAEVARLQRPRQLRPADRWRDDRKRWHRLDCRGHCAGDGGRCSANLPLRRFGGGQRPRHGFDIGRRQRFGECQGRRRRSQASGPPSILRDRGRSAPPRVSR